MQVQFTLTTADWREARYLHRTRGKRGGGEMFAWMLVAVPIIGSVGDLAHTAKESGITLRDTVLPLLLLLAAATMAMFLLLKRAQDRKAARLSGMTGVIWELQMHEAGFRRHCPEDESRSSATYRWEEFRDYRLGRHVVMLSINNSAQFEAIPLHAFGEEELERLKRLLARKIRAPRPKRESRTGLSVIQQRWTETMMRRAHKAPPKDKRLDS